jgi:glucose-6-phosphate isomerase, archaeal
LKTRDQETDRQFDPLLGVHARGIDLQFTYDPGVFGPQPELRKLSAIRKSLRDPECDGPDPVYSIVMDVGRNEHREELLRRMLLFGVVIYAAGQLGAEPVRSQGHVHSIAPHCGWSTPELFEIWEGRAIIYAQQRAEDNPGSCFAVDAGPGDQVVVPPGWAHAVINANPNGHLVFGAWCDRQYGFVYEAIRAHRGLAWFPILTMQGGIRWEPNPTYESSELVIRQARSYPELGLASQMPIYAQFATDPECVQWVSDPARLAALWPDFEP